MSKRDRTSVRTPVDLERKYDFEKRFVLNDELDQREVFDRLTNHGKSQGIFTGDDGNIYINASYLVTGVLQSQDKKTFYLDLVNGILKGQFQEFSIAGKTVDDIASDTLESQTQEEAFDKLTNGGAAKGIFYQDGELYINASYIVGSAPAGILQSVYPVGAIYISTVATSPATLFGFGTWEQIQDRFLLAAGSTYSAGATGGEATHTLTVDELPSHTHVVSNYTGVVGWEGSSPSKSYLANENDGYTGSTNPESKPTGGGKSHNNMPPYLAVYIWKRTA